MPNGKLSDKYKGKPFGQIAKEIQSKYQDRFDPISKRGLMSEMSALKDQQEFQKAKMEAQQMLQQAMTAPQQMQQPQGQMQAPIMASNQGVAPQMPIEQPMGHSASQSYNEQFAYGGSIEIDPAKRGTFKAQATRMGMSVQEAASAILNAREGTYSPEMRKKANFAKNFAHGYGGTMDYFNGGPFETTTIAESSGQESIAGQGQTATTNNPLRYAPLLANLYGIVSARRAPSTQSELSKMGYRTSIDENLGSQVTPRQTLFNNVDVSQLERGITNQARGFTGTNLNVSGGNAGQFLANELGNQGNVMNAIANARMQAQQQDRQTQAMNAQEQARIDQFLQAQAQNRQQLQSMNVGIGMQMADLDARNAGAFNTNRAAQIAGLATNLGNIGKESDQMKMIANALGYNSFGDFMAGLDPEQKSKVLGGLFQFAFK
jgi:hypothetical protein